MTREKETTRREIIRLNELCGLNELKLSEAAVVHQALDQEFQETKDLLVNTQEALRVMEINRDQNRAAAEELHSLRKRLEGTDRREAGLKRKLRGVERERDDLKRQLDVSRALLEDRGVVSTLR